MRLRHQALSVPCAAVTSGWAVAYAWAANHAGIAAPVRA